MRKTILVAVLSGLVGALIAVPVAVYASHSFTDVPNSNTFHADIDWLKDSGVTKGCNPPVNTRFCPDDYVTRGQMAAFMRRFAQYIRAEDGTPAQADNARRLGGRSADNLTVVAAADIDTELAGSIVSVVTTINEVEIEAPTDGILIINGSTHVSAGAAATTAIKPYVDNNSVGAYGSFDTLSPGVDDDDRFDNLAYTTAVAVSSGTHQVRQDIGQLFGDGLIGAQLLYNANMLTVLFIPGGSVTAAALAGTKDVPVP